MKTIYKNIIFLCCSLLFIDLSAQSVVFDWAINIGGRSNEDGQSVATDASGNVYVGGGFEGSADFDFGKDTLLLTTNGASDIFIKKLDPNGNLLWAKSMGSTDFDVCYSIAIDSNGNVYAIGTFSETVDFDPGSGVNNLTSNGKRDIFILKLNTDGDFIWVKQMGGSDYEWGYSIAVDADGQNVYSTGSFNGTVDFDPGTGMNTFTSNGSTDIFVQKLDANGNFIWAKQMGGSIDDVGHSIALGPNGGVYTTGEFYATVDFDPGVGIHNFTANGFKDLFIQKLDTNGQFVWAKQIGGTNTEHGKSITVSPSGYIYLTGIFHDVVDFDPNSGITNLTSKGVGDIFVEKLDANGNLIWVKQMDGISTKYCYTIALDHFENVYTTGYFYGQVDFDPGVGTKTLSSNGQYDIFIHKLDSSGDFQWVKQIGDNNWDVAKSITVDDFGNVYTVGNFSGSPDFDPDTGVTVLTTNGVNDFFVQKMRQRSFFTDVQTACHSFVWLDGKTYQNSDSTATYTLTNANGYDSVITLNLTIKRVSDLTIRVSGDSLIANNTKASTYQWLDCEDSMKVIPQQTNQFFIPPTEGSYAVRMQEDGCVDTSICIVTLKTGLEIKNDHDYTIFPNPVSVTQSEISITLPQNTSILSYDIYNNQGQRIQFGHVSTEQNSIPLSINQTGIFYLVLQNSATGMLIYRKVAVQ